jgi:ATPase subunit of ABC transporter with duplicated ATPase domains
VSHDRYFLERVTDQQYAILAGHLRHLPGGVDEYLRLREHEASAPTRSASSGGSASAAEQGSASLSGSDLRAAQKEIASLERRIAKLQQQINSSRVALADHDQSDYVGLGEKMAKIGALESEVGDLEERWLEQSELVD